MSNYIGSEVTVCVKSLWDKYCSSDPEAEEINIGTDGYIRHQATDDEDYYDLYTPYGTLAVMDGETATVIEETEDSIKLLSENGVDDVIFTLSREKFMTAC